MSKRKTIAIVLTLVLISSLFVGSAMALRESPLDPISRILQILLGIQPKINQMQNSLSQINSTLDGLESRLSNIEKSTMNSTQILFYLTNNTNVGSMTNWYFKVNADKPVLYTISVQLANLKIYNSLNADYMFITNNAAQRFLSFSALNGSNQYDTITFASTEMRLDLTSYVNTVGCSYTIMIQGTPGTSITTESGNGSVWIAY